PATPSPTPTPIPTPTPVPTPTATPQTSSASFIAVDATTHGSWKGTYGADGYNTINDRTTYPSYAQVGASSQLSYVWNASTNDLRGLQKVATNDRLAATWYATTFFTIDLNFSDGAAHKVVLNAITLTSGGFNVTTPQTFGADKLTRLMIFASGLNSLALNTNTSNDVIFGASIFPNIAESVVVEARTVDNRVFQLPVEFAGPSGQTYGLDQINVRLIGELRGAGSVEFTLIIAGRRSNTATIKIL